MGEAEKGGGYSEQGRGPPVGAWWRLARRRAAGGPGSVDVPGACRPRCLITQMDLDSLVVSSLLSEASRSL